MSLNPKKWKKKARREFIDFERNLELESMELDYKHTYLASKISIREYFEKVKGTHFR